MLPLCLSSGVRDKPEELEKREREIGEIENEVRRGGKRPKLTVIKQKRPNKLKTVGRIISSATEC